jgi:hypothetical protein
MLEPGFRQAQQPAGTALGQGIAGNALIGEAVMEILTFHSSALMACPMGFSWRG